MRTVYPIYPKAFGFMGLPKGWHTHVACVCRVAAEVWGAPQPRSMCRSDLLDDPSYTEGTGKKWAKAMIFTDDPSVFIRRSLRPIPRPEKGVRRSWD